jgi:hypothetical protein
MPDEFTSFIDRHVVPVAAAKWEQYGLACLHQRGQDDPLGPTPNPGGVQIACDHGFQGNRGWAMPSVEPHDVQAQP